LEGLGKAKWHPWLPQNWRSRRPKTSFELNKMDEITEQCLSVAEEQLNMANEMHMV
jgi:hypothetical protein